MIVLKEVDAVCIGVGCTGSILARELTKAGLKVVGLERGANRTAREDFVLPTVRDDLKYAIRQELFQDTQLETVSLRHSPSETALPIRRLADHEFMCDDYSIADIATWPWISRYEWQTIDLNAYPNVKRWYVAIAKRPAVQKGYDVPKKVQDIPMP